MVVNMATATVKPLKNGGNSNGNEISSGQAHETLKLQQDKFQIPIKGRGKSLHIKPSYVI